MNIVIIESPYAGDISANLDYVRACMDAQLASVGGSLPVAERDGDAVVGVTEGDDHRNLQRLLADRDGQERCEGILPIGQLYPDNMRQLWSHRCPC